MSQWESGFAAKTKKTLILVARGPGGGLQLVGQHHNIIRDLDLDGFLCHFERMASSLQIHLMVLESCQATIRYNCIPSRRREKVGEVWFFSFGRCPRNPRWHFHSVSSARVWSCGNYQPQQRLRVGCPGVSFIYRAYSVPFLIFQRPQLTWSPHCSLEKAGWVFAHHWT